MKIGPTALLALLAAGVATPVSAASPVPWPKAVRDFANPDEAVAVAGRFPNSAGMARRRLAAAVQAKDRAAAERVLKRLAAMGAVLSPAAQAQVEPLVGREAMAPIVARFAANSAPIAASRLHATIPADRDLVEGVVWDPAGRRLYATTVVDRNLLEVKPGATRIAASAGLGSLFGGAYDPAGRRLWIASAVVDETPRGEPVFTGLIGFDPKRPAGLRRVPLGPEAEGTPGDVAAARDGTVYASDGLNGALYRCKPGCRRLETLLPAGTFFSAQGLALSADQKRLYVADRRYGLAALDRATGRLLQVTGGDDVMLDGIDGLAAHRGDLVALQTAYPPARIVRLRLSSDGLRVAKLDVLERAHPEWGEITLGTVAGDRLLYVASAQWGRYGKGGEVKGDAPPEPTSIRSLKLR
ncbi:MAG TPA: hypothetical protein VF759_14785 [Allosphingosinicella sp.]|jgi:sugar lactone lactonase YvrE